MVDSSVHVSRRFFPADTADLSFRRVLGRDDVRADVFLVVGLGGQRFVLVAW